MMYFLVGIPLVVLVSVLFGGIMAKKMESVSTGKVFGVLAFSILFVGLLFLKLYLISL